MMTRMKTLPYCFSRDGEKFFLLLALEDSLLLEKQVGVPLAVTVLKMETL
jgi:hypothetical protein